MFTQSHGQHCTCSKHASQSDHSLLSSFTLPAPGDRQALLALHLSSIARPSSSHTSPSRWYGYDRFKNNVHQPVERSSISQTGLSTAPFEDVKQNGAGYRLNRTAPGRYTRHWKRSAFFRCKEELALGDLNRLCLQQLSSRHGATQRSKSENLWILAVKQLATGDSRGSTGPASVFDFSLPCILTASPNTHPFRLTYSRVDGLQELQNDEPDQLQAQDHNVGYTCADGSDAGF